MDAQYRSKDQEKARFIASNRLEEVQFCTVLLMMLVKACFCNTQVWFIIVYRYCMSCMRTYRSRLCLHYLLQPSQLFQTIALWCTKFRTRALSKRTLQGAKRPLWNMCLQGCLAHGREPRYWLCGKVELLRLRISREQPHGSSPGTQLSIRQKKNTG